MNQQALRQQRTRHWQPDPDSQACRASCEQAPAEQVPLQDVESQLLSVAPLHLHEQGCKAQRAGPLCSAERLLLAVAHELAQMATHEVAIACHLYALLTRAPLLRARKLTGEGNSAT